jgi:hypothetical protein
LRQEYDICGRKILPFSFAGVNQDEGGGNEYAGSALSNLAQQHLESPLPEW